MSELEYRIERKYPVNLEELQEVHYWMRQEGALFTPAYPPRTINNIYFDSPHWRSYADNADGIENRDKCRVRWYGETLDPEQARFEVKVRRGDPNEVLEEPAAEGGEGEGAGAGEEKPEDGPADDGGSGGGEGE